MRGRRLALVAVIPLALGIAGTGCGSDDGEKSSGSSSSNAVISWGIGEPQHLVPSNSTESNASDVLKSLFAPLVDFDKDQKPVEVAAEKISTTDGKVWTVKLKSGFTFHNGEKVVADNYIDAWNYAAYGPNAQDGNTFFARIAGYDAMNTVDPDGEDGPQKAPTPAADKLTGLKKIDDLTFEVTLSEPFSEWKAVMGYNVFHPLPKSAFSDMKKWEEAPIGQGPFKMKGTWEHDKQIQVERNDAYPLEKPKIGGILYRIYQDDAVQYSDLIANNLDVMTTIPTESLGTAPTDLGDRYKKSPSSYFGFLAYPTYDKRFAKVEVRKAFSMAIDRAEITKAIFKDTRTPASSFVNPIVPGAREDTCGDTCKLDAAKAKDLLQQAGGVPGNKVTISYNVDGGHKEWVDAACNQIKKNLGVDCVGAPEPKFANMLTKVEEKKAVGMFRLAWSYDYPSMENYLTPLYTCNASSNYYGYCNKAFDDKVAEGRRQANPDEAIKRYQEAEDILAKDVPVVPLWMGQNNFGHSTKVKNVEFDPQQRLDVMKIQAA